MSWYIYILFGALGAVVVVLFVFAWLAGALIYTAIGQAEGIERDDPPGWDSGATGEDDSYSKRLRQRARSRGAVAAEHGLSPSMCPYTTKDEPLRQEWMSGHLLVKIRDLEAKRPGINFVGQLPTFMKGTDATNDPVRKNRRRPDARHAG
jgi:ribosome modulation factor